MYEGLGGETKAPYVENQVPEECLDRIFCKSSETMNDLPDSSIHLMVTSPPYNVGKEYDQDLSLDEYREFIRKVMSEVYRVLVPGGRVCFNVANLGRKPYLPLEAFVTLDLIDAGFLPRGQIIWDKGASAGGSTAWGTFGSASNPTLRDTHEYILVFSKQTFSRHKVPGRKDTIPREHFLESTKSVWRFQPESARRAKHPAPFPVELPLRCIELYTYSNEVVLDPFMGSGSTAIAALETGRHFVGFDIDAGFVATAEARIAKYRRTKNQELFSDAAD